jgi:N-acetylmuramoyl-L-alanine amidase
VFLGSDGRRYGDIHNAAEMHVYPRDAAEPSVAWLLLENVGSVGKTDRLKARLLREAVEENIAAINGLVPKPLRRGRRFAALWGPRSAAVLLFLVLVGGLRLAPGIGTAVAQSTSVQQNQVATSAQAPAPISFPKPQPINVSALALGVRRVVLDAGHGGKSLGTFGAKGLREKDVTLDIADRLRRRLAGEGVAVLMTRESDETISLQERSEMANRGHGDIFVSIHVNALTSKESRGVETYYLGQSEAPAIDAIAADENRDSGYSLADLRTLVNMIYMDARKDESKRLAESVQRALLRNLRRVNPAIEDRGVKTAPFVVLVGTRMPAILAEVSCLSNDEEAELLNGAGYRQSIADALLDGLHAYLRAGATDGRRETVNGS